MDAEQEAREDISNGTTLSGEEKQKILLTLGLGAAISLMVCFVALGMAFMKKLYRYTVHRLAMYQVMAALLVSAIHLLELTSINHNNIHNPLCITLGFLMEYVILVKIMFILCLTFHLFCFSICHVNLNQLEIMHILISIITPLLFVWIPFIHHLYGLAGAWCWIKNWKDNHADSKIVEGEIEQYALLYGPAIISLSMANIAVIVIISVLTCRAYGCCNKHYRLLVKEEKYKKVLKEVLPLVAYPILSFLLYIPGFINRLIGSVTKDVNFASFILSAISSTSLNFFAGLTFIIHILILECSKQTTVSYNITVRRNSSFVPITDTFTSQKKISD